MFYFFNIQRHCFSFSYFSLEGNITTALIFYGEKSCYDASSSIILAAHGVCRLDSDYMNTFRRFSEIFVKRQKTGDHGSPGN